MVAQTMFPWFEQVHPPDDLAKTVHVRNHWRKPPRSRARDRSRETGGQSRITEVKPLVKKEA